MRRNPRDNSNAGSTVFVEGRNPRCFNCRKLGRVGTEGNSLRGVEVEKRRGERTESSNQGKCWFSGKKKTLPTSHLKVQTKTLKSSHKRIN